ncbi:phosphoribosyltransferase-like protein [Limtongia smithiae]|uniref:phosphoribosyltransferase-like protein n=1 Tax=Limtongia smithiae TaxID=1125753 RepID=UPI0034CD5EC2
MRNLVVFGGSSHPELVERICNILGIQQGGLTTGKFSNGETSVSIQESVREKDVYVIQSGCGHVNDTFIELLITIAACKTASARRVTAVMPLFPYSRQPDLPYNKLGAPLAKASTPTPTEKPSSQKYTFESIPPSPRHVSSVAHTPTEFPTSTPGFPFLSAAGSQPLPAAAARALDKEFEKLRMKDTPATTSMWQPRSGVAEINTGYKEWVAQSGTLVADLLTCAGADHIITMDLHDPQFQGFFDIPVDNLYGRPILQHYITSAIPNYQEAVIVSPDAGGAKRATKIADALGMDFALIHKERRTMRDHNGVKHHGREHASMMLVGDVTNRVALLIDDLVDTSNTITRAAKLLKDRGAIKVYAIITHGIFSGDAVQRITASALDKVVTTNSAPQLQNKMLLGDKLEILDISKIFAEAIRRIHNGESVSMLFDLSTL